VALNTLSLPGGVTAAWTGLISGERTGWLFKPVFDTSEARPEKFLRVS
jgi:hypothetical protein